MSFEYSIKALGLTKGSNPTFSRLLIKYLYFDSHESFACRYVLSKSGCLFIKFSNAFVFPDLEAPIIIILYG